MCRYVGITRRTEKTPKEEFVEQDDEKYLKLGSAVAPRDEQWPRPLGIECFIIFSNDAMKPFKLAHHFPSKHRKTISQKNENENNDYY